MLIKTPDRDEPRDGLLNNQIESSDGSKYVRHQTAGEARLLCKLDGDWKTYLHFLLVFLCIVRSSSRRRTDRRTGRLRDGNRR